MQNPNSNDLTSIHRAALQKLNLFRPVQNNDICSDDDPEVSFLQERLTTLRKRRLQLYSNIQELQFNQTLLPLSDEIILMKSRCVDDAAMATSTSRRDVPSQAPPTANRRKDDEPKVPLAQRMHSLRKRRRIVGSHRIAGISIIPCPDTNVLGIRLDVAIDGRYVAKHFLFLDIVTTVSWDEGGDDDTTDNALYLRLVQHTLPPGVTLPTIIQRHFGDTMLLLPEHVLTKSAMAIVRTMVGDIHDACYANAIRRQGVDFLKKYTTNSDATKDFVVHNLKFPDTFRHVDFEVIWTTPATLRRNGELRRLVIQLEYHEESNPQPTSVHVAQGDERIDKNDWIPKSIEMLRSMPIWKFFDALRGFAWRT
jgi:Cenp-O kinetochore centromere component